MDGSPKSPAEPERTADGRRVGRAVFLATVAGGLASLAVGKTVWSAVSRTISPVESLVPLIPSGWRIYTISGSMPEFDRTTWRLTVGGMAAKPLSLRYEDLLALPKTTQISTFHCVTGWTVDNVHWGGVRLAELLARAEPSSAAHGLHFISAEHPYDDYLTTAQASLHDVLLAYEMNGAPLPREHGAPVRLVIPEMYGYKNVKWLEQIDLVAAPGTGYWENLGYDRDAWVGRSNGYGS